MPELLGANPLTGSKSRPSTRSDPPSPPRHLPSPEWERILDPLTTGFIALTLVVFLGPAFILGLEGTGRVVAEAVFGALSWGLLGLQVLLLLLAIPVLATVARPESFRASLLSVGAVQILALGYAAWLSAGTSGAGPIGGLLQALGFAAPLALWAVVAWPRPPSSRPQAWVAPTRWLLFGFPLMYLLAGLARFDFSLWTGTPLPTAIAWLLAYGPTLIGVTLAVAGWIALLGTRGVPQHGVGEIAAVGLGALVLVTLATVGSMAAFVLSATLTWGSGYQLFTTPPPFPPLALSLFLATLALVALVAVLGVYRHDRRLRVVLLLGLTAVLSGIFPVSRSVLGGLIAVELLRWRVAGGG